MRGLFNFLKVYGRLVESKVRADVLYDIIKSEGEITLETAYRILGHEKEAEKERKEYERRLNRQKLYTEHVSVCGGDCECQKV